MEVKAGGKHDRCPDAGSFKKRNGGKQVSNYRFTVLIEKDEDGILVASVPALKGCHTQAKSMDDLLARTREAIGLCLDIGKAELYQNQFVGVQQIEISV